MSLYGVMSPRIALIISSFNRPRLVVDAIESVKDQSYKRFLCVVADDDSNAETVQAIRSAVGDDLRFVVMENAAGSPSADQRKSELRYCKTINAALALILAEYPSVEFLSFLPDDDYLMKECFEARMKIFDENPDQHVTYTKQRSLTFDVDSHWDSRGVPKPGRSYPKEGEVDPDTGGPIDIASWWPGLRSPIRGIDHGSICHRRVCLDEMGGPPWWPEGPCSDVGDGLYFDRLTALGHVALAIPVIGHTKRFHGRSYGRVGTSSVRE